VEVQVVHQGFALVKCGGAHETFEHIGGVEEGEGGVGGQVGEGEGEGKLRLRGPEEWVVGEV